MVSFRVLLFISASEEFGEDGADGGDTAKAEGDDDPVDQDLFAAFDRKIWRARVLFGWRGGFGFGLRIHWLSLRYMRQPQAGRASLQRVRLWLGVQARAARGPASQVGSG